MIYIYIYIHKYIIFLFLKDKFRNDLGKELGASQWNMELLNPPEVKGILLEQPRLSLAKTNAIPENGDFKKALRSGIIKDPCNFNNWVLIYQVN